MKILHLTGYKCLLSQNQRVRKDFVFFVIDILDTGEAYQTFKKNINVKGLQWSGYNKHSWMVSPIN